MTKKRTSYLCTKCGQLKKGHHCEGKKKTAALRLHEGLRKKMMQKGRFCKPDKTNDTKGSSAQTTEEKAAMDTITRHIAQKHKNTANTAGDKTDTCFNNEQPSPLEPSMLGSVDFLAEIIFDNEKD